jgi:predicted nucleic acid-binding protein
MTPLAVLDACVLYPAPLRDVLLSLADEGLFMPKWSDHIHTEWSQNLLLKRPDLTEQQLKATVQAMNKAFPHANTHKYSSLIPGIHLPDPRDRHVVAVALKSQAQTIVTFNLKDFPPTSLHPLQLQAQHPDAFLVQLTTQYPNKASIALKSMIGRLKHPPIATADVLKTLESGGVPQFVAIVRPLL